jgi:hypothetical protein
MVQSSAEDLIIHSCTSLSSDTLQEQGKDDRVVDEPTMTTAVASAETSHSNKPLHACNIHGVDQDARGIREQRRAFEDQLGREIDAERLDNHLDVPECIPDGIAI